MRETILAVLAVFRSIERMDTRLGVVRAGMLQGREW